MGHLGQSQSESRLVDASESTKHNLAARERQRERFDGRANTTEVTSGGGSGNHVLTNADIRVAEIRQYSKLEAAGESLVRAAMGQMNLSHRGYPG